MLNAAALMDVARKLGKKERDRGGCYIITVILKKGFSVVWIRAPNGHGTGPNT